MTTGLPTFRQLPPDLRLIATLNRREQPVLRIDRDRDLLVEVFEDEPKALAAVRKLARREVLVPIRRGAWAVRSERGTLPAGALALVGWLTPQTHLVSAGAALARHGLTDQAFRTIIVAVAVPQRDWAWQGEQVAYREVSPSRLWGAARSRSARQGALTQVASAEKAVLDCLAHPSWGVSVPQVAQAIARYLGRRPEGDAEPLFAAARRLGVQAVTQRLGYLTELVAGEGAAEPIHRLVPTNAAVVTLGTRSGRSGTLNTRWRVRVNIPEDALLEHQLVG